MNAADVDSVQTLHHRERLGRSLVFMARHDHRRMDHRREGLGIDKNTAVLVEAGGSAEVTARS